MNLEDLPKESVLHPVNDLQLIRKLESYAENAGIGGHKEYIWLSVKNNKYINTSDLELIKHLPFKKSEATGAVYLKRGTTLLAGKFMALTGLLLRNYINVKYYTCQEMLSDLQEGEPVDGQVIFCPDFCTKTSKSGKSTILPQWKRDMFMSFLLEKQRQGTDLILGLYDWKAAEEMYGKEIISFLDSNFIEVE